MMDNNTGLDLLGSGALFDKKIWKVKHVAAYLDCSQKTIYEKARLGNIPSIKKGKFRYFIPHEIENWLLEGNL